MIIDWMFNKLRLNVIEQQTGHDQDGQRAHHLPPTETFTDRSESDAVDPFAFLSTFSRQHALFVSACSACLVFYENFVIKAIYPHFWNTLLPIFEFYFYTMHIITV